MDFTLNEDQEILRKEIIRFAQKELNDGILERDRDESFSREQWEKCGEMGLQGLPVPEEYGGSGLDSLSTAIALEAFGYGCHDGGLIFSICAHLLACLVPIWKYGSEDQKKRYLPGLCNGSLIAVNAMTEPGSGSDAFDMNTRAVPEGDGFRINGTKIMSTNGPVADLVVAYALTDPEKGAHGGITAFIVETKVDGLTRGQKFEKMGLRTSMLGEIILDDVHVTNEAVLGHVGSGSGAFIESMEWERICIAASHVGTMERLLEQSVEYARVRTSSGQPIGKYQAVSHKIADMKISLEATRYLVYRSAGNIGRNRANAMDASITKVFASEALLNTAHSAVQIFGGYGYMTESEVERTLRDAIGSTIYSGTNEIQRNIIAAWLGL